MEILAGSVPARCRFCGHSGVEHDPQLGCFGTVTERQCGDGVCPCDEWADAQAEARWQFGPERADYRRGVDE